MYLECILELQIYHVITNLVADLMHDILEGICHYNFCAILEELISVKRYFTLQILNDRIQNFEYNFDIGNKPSIITLDHIRAEKLKMCIRNVTDDFRELADG